VDALGEVAKRVPLLFLVHPRTSERSERWHIDVSPRVVLSPPLPYMAFLGLWRRSALVNHR
jgi:UDP-N-acetylglucosamine 2-epimerase (non-hydrolysing)